MCRVWKSYKLEAVGKSGFGIDTFIKFAENSVQLQTFNRNKKGTSL